MLTQLRCESMPPSVLRLNRMNTNADPDSPLETSSTIPADTVVRRTATARKTGGGIFALRRPIPQWVGILLGIICIVTVLGIWWFLTRGVPEERILSYRSLPSPAETLNRDQFH